MAAKAGTAGADFIKTSTKTVSTRTLQLNQRNLAKHAVHGTHGNTQTH